MIRKAENNEVEIVAKYAYRLNSEQRHRCKAFPTDYDSILNQFKKILNHPNDELLILADDCEINGVLALLVEPDDRYIEAIGGVFAEYNYEATAKEFYKYLKTRYCGYQFDAAYPEENIQAIDFMKSIGARLLGYDFEFKLHKSEYKAFPETDNIVRLNSKFYKSFIEIHDKFNPDVYWTGEKLINALDKFNVFIALENDEVIGSVVISNLSNKTEEIYFIEVEESKQNHGYGTALMNKAIQNAFRNGTDEIMVMAEKDNLTAIHILEKFGFRETDSCLTYSKRIEP